MSEDLQSTPALLLSEWRMILLHVNVVHATFSWTGEELNSLASSVWREGRSD